MSGSAERPDASGLAYMLPGRVGTMAQKLMLWPMLCLRVCSATRAQDVHTWHLDQGFVPGICALKHRGIIDLHKRTWDELELGRGQGERSLTTPPRDLPGSSVKLQHSQSTQAARSACTMARTLYSVKLQHSQNSWQAGQACMLGATP